MIDVGTLGRFSMATQAIQQWQLLGGPFGEVGGEGVVQLAQGHPGAVRSLGIEGTLTNHLGSEEWYGVCVCVCVCVCEGRDR